MEAIRSSETSVNCYRTTGHRTGEAQRKNMVLFRHQVAKQNYIVALTAVAVEQANNKQGLQPVSRQRRSKHASRTIKLLLETVFSTRSV
jgi:riboflavin synthase